MKRLAIVVPCYNEEAVLLDTTKKLIGVLDGLKMELAVSSDSFLLYVNDGSSDATWSIVEKLHSENASVCGVCLAGNVGHQRALVAGLATALQYADIMVSIDADLQDDETVIAEMVRHNECGYDIVYGVRSSRKTDTGFKRITALLFYRLMQALGVKTIYNHSDFRLMSKRAVSYLLQFSERNLYLRGMIPMLGYKSTCVYYDRRSRLAGESKYPLVKMLGLALEGVTSFSIKPFHLILSLGLFFLVVSFCILLWVLYSYFSGNVVPGWSSLMLSIWFCTGCVLVCMGVVGEYIGKIYLEVKKRPLYNIENVLI
jgi:glycosyltransferase involved in cell wall biosynthesis